MTLTGAGKAEEKEQRWEDADVDVTASGSVGQDLLVELKLDRDCQDGMQFTLFRGDVPMPSDRYQVQSRGNVVQLTLKKSQKDDSGHYALVAKKLSTGLSISGDEGVESKHRIHLSIQDPSSILDEVEPPIFLRRLSDLAVKVGTRTRFLVEIRSPTTPKVTWHKNDEIVHSGSRFSFVHEGNFYCVDVAPVMVDDQGHWTCMAENGSGRSSCTSFLSVIVPKAYKKPEFVENLRALLTETGTVSLECKVVGVPTPVLKWFKDQKEIKAGDVFALTANPEDPTSLGTYTCEAVNCMGTVCSSSKVHVVGKGSREGSLKPADALTPSGPLPVFRQILRDESCKIGDSLSLSCQVHVPPWPKTITWYNKEGRVDPNEKYHLMADGLGGYSIEINGVEAMDEGEWKCVATSAENMKQFTTCHVAMSIPKNYRLPRFMESLKAVLTEEGLVSFECKVVGFPTPLLRWFKDGQELHPGDVYQLTGTNSLGSYCCIARNCMGEAKSIAELTIEDIQNQLNEEERMQLLSSNQAPKFVKGLRSCEARINEDFTFAIQVSVSPEPSLSWYRDDVAIIESEKYRLAREALGTCNLEVRKLEFVDQAEWKCIAANDFGHSVTSCFLKLVIPKHFKKPKFLESLRAILSEEGAVNLECKVIGVPQPILKWYKDGIELKPGDIHRIISGQDGTCCLGTYTCEATNCMGSVSSSASLLGFEDRVSVRKEEAKEPAMPLHELARNLSLSTIHEERTSQLYDTPQTDHSITMDDRGEVSFSFDGKEVSVSLYETPDLTEEEALQIVEMYADQLSEHITEGNVIELPPMRFTKETSTTGNLLMEAVVIDVSPDYFVPDEEGDDLRTEADVEDVSIMDDQMQSVRSSCYVSSPTTETPGSPPSRPPRRKESRESFSSRSERSEKSLPNWSESYHSAKEPSMQAQSSIQGQDDSGEAFTDALSSSGAARSKADDSRDVYASFVEQNVEKIPLVETMMEISKRDTGAEENIPTESREAVNDETLLKRRKKKKDRQQSGKSSRTPSLSSKASSEESCSMEVDEKGTRRAGKNGKERRGSAASNKSEQGRRSRRGSGKFLPDATIMVDDVKIEQSEEITRTKPTVRSEDARANESLEEKAASTAVETSMADREKSAMKKNKERLLESLWELSQPVMSLRSTLVDLDKLLPCLQARGSSAEAEISQSEIAERIILPVENLCEQVAAIETKALKSATDRSLAQNVRISLLEAIGGPTEELLRGIELMRRDSRQHDLKSSLIILESLTDPVDEILMGLTRIERELTSSEGVESSLLQLEKPIALERMTRAVSCLGKSIARTTERSIVFGDESTSLCVTERLQSVFQSLEAFLSTVPLSESSGALENNVDTLVVETLVRPLEELSRNVNAFNLADAQTRDVSLTNLEQSMMEMKTRLEALTIALETYENESGERGITELHADLVKFLRYTMDDAVERLDKSKLKKKRVTQEAAKKRALDSANLRDEVRATDDESAIDSAVESSEPEEKNVPAETTSAVERSMVPSISGKEVIEAESRLSESARLLSIIDEKSSTENEDAPASSGETKAESTKEKVFEEIAVESSKAEKIIDRPAEPDTDLTLPEMLLDPLIDVQANLSDVISDFESQESGDESSLPGGSELAACLAELRESVATAAHTATTLKSDSTLEALVDLREPLLDLQLAMASATSPGEIKLIREAIAPLAELKIVVTTAIGSSQTSEASRVQMKSVLRMLDDIEAEVKKMDSSERAPASPMTAEVATDRKVPTRPPEDVERAAFALTGVHFALSTVLERIATSSTETEDSASSGKKKPSEKPMERTVISNLITSIERLRESIGDVAVAIGSPIVLSENNDRYSYDVLFDELAKLEEPLLDLQRVLLTERHEPEDRHVLNDVANPIRSLKEIVQDVTSGIGNESLPPILELIEDVEKDVTLVAMEALKKALATKAEISTDDDGRASISSLSKPGEVSGVISKWFDPIESWLSSAVEESTEIEEYPEKSSIAPAVDDLKRELLKIAIQTTYSEPPSDVALIESLTELQEPLARVYQVLNESHEPENLEIVEELVQPMKHLLGTILDASLVHEAGKLLRPVLEAIEELENQIPLTIKRITYERELQRVVRSMTPEEPKTLVADDIPESYGESSRPDEVFEKKVMLGAGEFKVETEASVASICESSKTPEQKVEHVQVIDSAEERARIDQAGVLTDSAIDGAESARTSSMPEKSVREKEEATKSRLQESENKMETLEAEFDKNESSPNNDLRDICVASKLKDGLEKERARSGSAEQQVQRLKESGSETKREESRSESDIVTEGKKLQPSESQNVPAETVEVITVDNRQLSVAINPLEAAMTAEASAAQMTRADQLDLWSLTLLGPLDRLGNAVLSLDRSIDELAHGLLCRPLDSLHKQIEIAESQFNRPIGQSLENDVETIIEGFLSPVKQLHCALRAAVDVWNDEQPRMIVRDLLRSIADSSTELRELLNTLRQEMIVESAHQSLQEQQENASLVETMNAVIAPLDDVRNLIEEALKNLEFVDSQGQVETDRSACEKTKDDDDEKEIQDDDGNKMIRGSDDEAVKFSDEKVTSIESTESVEASAKKSFVVEEAAEISAIEVSESAQEREEKSGETEKAMEVIEEPLRSEVLTSMPEIAIAAKKSNKAKEDSMQIEETTAKPLEELIEAIVDSSSVPGRVSSSPEGYQSVTPDISEKKTASLAAEAAKIEAPVDESVAEFDAEKFSEVKAEILGEEDLAKVTICPNVEVSESTSDIAENVSVQGQVPQEGQKTDQGTNVLEDLCRVEFVAEPEVRVISQQAVEEILGQATGAAAAEEKQTEIKLTTPKQAENSEETVQEEILETVRSDDCQGEKVSLVSEASLSEARSRKVQSFRLESSEVSQDVVPEDGIGEIPAESLPNEKAQICESENLSAAKVMEAPEIKIKPTDAAVTESASSQEAVRELPPEKVEQHSAEVREVENLASAVVAEAPQTKIKVERVESSELQSQDDGEIRGEISSGKTELQQAETREGETLAKAGIADTPEIKIKARNAESSELKPEMTEDNLFDISGEETEKQRAELRESESLTKAAITDTPETRIMPRDAKLSELQPEVVAETVDEIRGEKIAERKAALCETDELTEAIITDAPELKIKTRDAKLSQLEGEIIGHSVDEITGEKMDECTAELREGESLAKAEATKAPEARLKESSQLAEISEEGVEKLVVENLEYRKADLRASESLPKAEVTDGLEARIKPLNAISSQSLPEVPDESVHGILPDTIEEQKAEPCESDSLNKAEMVAPETRESAKIETLQTAGGIEQSLQLIPQELSEKSEGTASVQEHSTHIAKIRAIEVAKFSEQDIIRAQESDIVEILETPTQKIFKVKKDATEKGECAKIVEKIVVKPVEEVVAMEDENIFEIVETPTEKVIKMKIPSRGKDNVEGEVVEEIVVQKPIAGWAKTLVEEEERAFSVSDAKIQEFVAESHSVLESCEKKETEDLGKKEDEQKFKVPMMEELEGEAREAELRKKDEGRLENEEFERQEGLKMEGERSTEEGKLQKGEAGKPDSLERERKETEDFQHREKETLEAELVKNEKDRLEREEEAARLERQEREHREEAERVKKEEGEKRERERVQKEEAEAERLKREEEKLTNEKIQKEKEEAERRKKEEAEKHEKEKLEKEKAEAERLKKEEAERLAKEKLQKEKEEAERVKKEEEENLAREKLQKEREEAERIKKEEEEKLATEKLQKEKEEAEKLAKEKLEKEKAEAERLKREEEEKREEERLQRKAEEAERLKKEEAEKLAKEKLQKEKDEPERVKKEEEEKLAREKLQKESEEAERRKRDEAEKREKEMLQKEKEEAEKLAEEKLQKEKAEAERLKREEGKREEERLQREAEEAERLKKEEAEKLAKEQLQKEKDESERVKKEEEEKLAREKLQKEVEEAERLKREEEKLEKEKLQKEKDEAERVKKEEAEKLAKEKLQKEKDEAERVKREEAEKREKERLEREAEKAECLRKEEAEKLAKEKLQKEKDESERVKKEEEEKLAREKLQKEREEAERLKREEEEKREKLRKEKEEAERLKREEEEKLEKEKLQKENEEAERVKREEAEKLAKEKLQKENEEAERVKREEAEKLAKEKLQKEKEEAERVKREEAEKLAKEKLQKEKEEAERVKREEAEKLAKEKLQKEKEEAERVKREEAEKLAKEKLQKEKEEAERVQREEAEKLAKEKLQKEKEEAERVKREEAEKLAKEKLQKEKKEAERVKREEAEKLAKEKLQKEKEEAKRVQREEAEKLVKEKLQKEKEEAERVKREEAEKLAKEKLQKEKEEAERVKREEAEKLAKEKLQKEKEEAERVQREEAEKLAKEKLQKEKEEAEHVKREEAEKLAKEKLQKEKEEAERVQREEAEKLAKEKLQKEKEEAERVKREEAEKLAKEKEEAERAKKEEAEKREKEKIKKEKEEAERLKKEEAEKVANEKLEKEKAEADRLQREEEEKREKEKLQKEKEEAERVKKEEEEKRAREKLQKEKEEAERMEKEEEKKREKERLQKEKEEADRAEKEQGEKRAKEKLEKEKEKADNLEKEKSVKGKEDQSKQLKKDEPRKSSMKDDSKDQSRRSSKAEELKSESKPLKKDDSKEESPQSSKKEGSRKNSKKDDSKDEVKRVKKKDSKEGSRRGSKNDDTEDKPKRLKKKDSKEESPQISKKEQSADELRRSSKTDDTEERPKRLKKKDSKDETAQLLKKDDSKKDPRPSSIKVDAKRESDVPEAEPKSLKKTDSLTENDRFSKIQSKEKIPPMESERVSKQLEDEQEDEKTPINSEQETREPPNQPDLRLNQESALDHEPRSSSTIRTDSEMESEYSESAKPRDQGLPPKNRRRRRSDQQPVIEIDNDNSKDPCELRDADRQHWNKTRDETLSSDDRHYYSATNRNHEFTPGPRDRGKKPSFCMKLTDRTAAEGSRIKLTCTVLGDPEPQVYWTKDGKELPSSSNRHCTMEENGMISLELYSALPKDSGEYSCIANNIHGQAYTEAKLKVYPGYEPLPARPTFTRSIKENELVLECRVRGQPSPKITWHKDGQVLEMGDRYQQCDMIDGVCRLKISRPDFYDSGLYTCKAENESKISDCTSHVVNFDEKGVEHGAGWRESYRNLTSSDRETGRPKFSSCLTDHSVPIGGTIALQVEVKGVPAPDITWLRGDKREPIPAYKARTFADSGVYTLIVPEATESETGTYVCRASNAYGYVDTAANVEVVSSSPSDGGKPAMFVSRPAETMIHVTAEEDVSVSFRVSGIPKPRIVWMKGLRDITNGPRSYKESSDDYVRLTLKRAAVSDEGTYCIMAKNRYGCDRTFYTVKVKQRARSLTPLQDWGTLDTDSLLADIHDTERSYFKQVPGAITSEPVVVDGGRNWLALSWGKAVQNGPAPVVAYRVDAWLVGGEGGARWVELGITPVNAFDAFNLRPGGEYKFRITPRNRYGWGEAFTMTSSILVRGLVKFPEFTKILPGQLKALRGETLHLECEVRSESKADVKWYRDTTDVDALQDPRYMTHYNGSKCTMIVQSIKENDSGRYVCEATNPAGRVSTFARVQVVNDPKIVEADEKLRRMRALEPGNEERPPEFTMRLRDRRVQMTYPVRITCQVSGHPEPEVTWYKNREEIFQDENVSFWDDESHFHTLEISHSSVEDSGVYMAKARNFNGSVSCRCNLVVDKGIRAYIAPEFMRHLDAVYTVKSGGELRMSAQIEAYPTVGIVWHRDGHRLRPSRSAVMSLNHDGSVELSLAHVTPRDAGLYCCTATNEVGQTESTARVTVIGSTDEDISSISQSLPDVVESLDVPYSKEPLFVTKPLSTEAVEGDTVIILCEVVGDPKPEVIWLRDFLRPDYYRDAPHFRRVGAGPQYRLEIPYAKLDFTGAYTVIAKNCHGEAKAIISLQIYARGQGKSHSGMDHATIKHGKVQTLPSIKRPLRDLRCCDGDAVTLICKVHATPEPDVRWEKSGKLLPLGGDFVADFDGETARLSIQHVYPEDEGEYTCVAYNALGKAFTSACLIVDVPEGKESALSRRLIRPIGLLSAESTPISTPRSTPIRSLSPSCVSSRRELKPASITPRGQSMSRRPRLPTGPKFYAVPHNRVAEEGETVRFQCAIAGHPTPWVYWDKDGVSVTPTARISLRENDDVRILEITEINHEDAGLYRITLENDVGRTEATARLEIIKGRQGSIARTIRTRSASPRTYSIYSRSPVTSAVRGDTHLRPNAHEPASGRGGTLSPTLPRWQYRKNECSVESPEVARRKNEQRRTTTASNGQATKSRNLKVPVPATPRSSSLPRRKPGGTAVKNANAKQTKKSLSQRATSDEGNDPANESWKKTKTTTSNGGSMIPKRLPFSRSRPTKLKETTPGGKRNPEELVTFEVSKDIDEAKKNNEKMESTIPRVDDEKSSGPRKARESALTNEICTKNSFPVVNDTKKPRPPVILSAPADVVALRGTKVTLLATYDGEPQPRVRWLRKGRDVRLDDKAEIETSRGLTCLTLDKVTTEETGKYAVTLENTAGKDCRYVNLTVEGVPDPPAGTPCVQSITRSGKAIVTWRSPSYDGGCAVTGYSVEMKRSEEPCWIAVAEARHSLSHTVTGLAPQDTYRFRVRAENAHGLSEPSAISDIVAVPGENDEEVGGQVFTAEINQIEIEEEEDEFEPAFEARIVTPEDGSLFQERYDVMEELGKGKYGIVRRISEKSSGMNLAAKFVRTIKTKDRQQVYDEIGIMNRLRHPKLLRLAAAYENPKDIIMVTEYISGGELFERVVADDFTLTEKDSIQFVKQICEGVEYMHDQNIVHLDLKPENVMCHTRTSHRIKLIDFGLAQTLNPDTPIRVLFGTPEFIPPEIIGFEPIGTESDMWSIGVICYVLLSGLSPFMGDNDAETFANITRADYDFDDKAFAAISLEAKDFISSLLIKKKESRMSAKQCLEHPWLAQHAESMSRVALPTDKLKKFIVRRKWQKTGNAIRALGRMAILSANSRRNVSASSSPTKTNSFDEDLFDDVMEDIEGFKPILPAAVAEHTAPGDPEEKTFETLERNEEKFNENNIELSESRKFEKSPEVDEPSYEEETKKLVDDESDLCRDETSEEDDRFAVTEIDDVQDSGSNDIKNISPLIQENDDFIEKENGNDENSANDVCIEELPCDTPTDSEVIDDLDSRNVSDSFFTETTRKQSFSSFVNLEINETGVVEKQRGTNNENSEAEEYVKYEFENGKEESMELEATEKILLDKIAPSNAAEDHEEIHESKTRSSVFTKAWCNTNNSTPVDEEDESTRIMGHSRTLPFVRTGSVSRKAKMFEKVEETKCSSLKKQQNPIERTTPMLPETRPENERIRQAFAFWNK